MNTALTASTYRQHSVLRAIVFSMAALVYCQVHGALLGDETSLAVSMAWSATAVLPWWAAWEALSTARIVSPRATDRWLVLIAVPMLALATSTTLWQLIMPLVLDGSRTPWAETMFARAPLVPLVAWAAHVGRPTFQSHKSPLARPTPGPAETISLAVTTRAGTIALSVADIDTIQAAGNYVEVSANGETYLRRDTLAALEGRLTAEGFLRVHRRWLVNTAAVRTLETRPKGRLFILMRDDSNVPVGRSFVTRVRDRLER